MTEPDADTDQPTPWADAAHAAALFAVDPAGTGGVALRAAAGPVRDRWLALLREKFPAAEPMKRVPLGIGDGRLLGGLDLAATLRSGKLVAERGVLAEADGGIVIFAMAERLSPATTGRLTAILDAGEILLARDGIEQSFPARLGVVALDEGISDDETAPTALRDRLAFALDFSSIAFRATADDGITAEDIASAREKLPHMREDETIVEALCGTAMALGIMSLRAPLLALNVARAAAALAGRDHVAMEDAALASRLVLAPRATILPAGEPAPEATDSDDQTEDGPPDPPPESQDSAEDDAPPDGPLGEILLQAARVAIPAGLLARLKTFQARTAGAPTAGRVGAVQKSGLRGRPAGTRAGDPRGGIRLSVIETLRAAAPWQRIRAQESGRAQKIAIRRDDFRVNRLKQRAETTTIFVVDASGSSAVNRLAEAKGAVELLLADCYVRRDRVAVVAFRGAAAQLLLPPTRSLVRAKRSLAGLPGGGGTPLAAGIAAGVELASGTRRRGGTPTIVLLTDARANVCRDGTGGRARAEQEALAAGKLIRAQKFPSLLIDVSPRPNPAAGRLAEAMGARYLPLPYADSGLLSRAVRAASAPG